MTSQTIGTVQLKWNNTLRAEAIMGTNQRGSKSSDGITEQTKKETKGVLEGATEEGTKHGKANQGRPIQNKA